MFTVVCDNPVVVAFRKKAVWPNAAATDDGCWRRLGVGVSWLSAAADCKSSAAALDVSYQRLIGHCNRRQANSRHRACVCNTVGLITRHCCSPASCLFLTHTAVLAKCFHIHAVFTVYTILWYFIVWIAPVGLFGLLRHLITYSKDIS